MPGKSGSLHALCLLALGLAGHPATAQITVSGDVHPFFGPGDVNDPLLDVHIADGSVSLDNANLTASTIVVGDTVDAAGTMIVDNSNVTLTRQTPEPVDGLNFEVGSQGFGTLVVRNGSTFDVFQGVDCSVVGCPTFVGNAAGSTGSIQVKGAGTSLSTQDMYVGSAAVFTLANDGNDFGEPGGTTMGHVSALDQAVVNTAATYIGLGAGGGSPTGEEFSFGSVRVGTAATWNADSVAVGLASTANGSLVVDSGGQLNTTGAVAIGYGSLAVRSGGGLTQNGISVGDLALDVQATAQISGVGTTVDFTGPDPYLAPGVVGSGHVEIFDGAQVNGAFSFVAGLYAEGRGSFAVDGAATAVNLSGVCSLCLFLPAPGFGAVMAVGGGGKGAGTISGGATFTIDGSGNTSGTGIFVGGTGPSLLGGTASGEGVLEVRDAGTSLTVSGGNELLEVGNDGGEGALYIAAGAEVTLANDTGNAAARFGDNDGVAALRIEGAGSLLDAGDSFVAGNVDGSAGAKATIVLEDGGELRADTITFNPGTVVSGDGGLLTGTVFNHGTLLPGNSPGVMNIDGDLNLFDDGTLIIEIGGTTAGIEYDVFNITGTLSLAGTLEILLLDGFTPQAGDTFSVFNAADTLGAFDTVIFPELGDGRSFVFSLDGAVSVVPLPAGVWLLGAGFGLVAVRRHKRTNPD